MIMSQAHFATLTPANARAKAAFSAVVAESLLHGQDTGPDQAGLSIFVRTQQEFDKEVLLYRREIVRDRSNQHLSDDSTTDIETDIEGETRDRGVSEPARRNFSSTSDAQCSIGL